MCYLIPESTLRCKFNEISCSNLRLHFVISHLRHVYNSSLFLSCDCHRVQATCWIYCAKANCGVPGPTILTLKVTCSILPTRFSAFFRCHKILYYTNLSIIKNNFIFEVSMLLQRIDKINKKKSLKLNFHFYFPRNTSQ